MLVLARTVGPALSLTTVSFAVGGHHFAGQEVGRPDESGDEQCCRAVVDLLGGTDLFDATIAHHGDAVAHRERLTLVVGHEHERDADLALDPLEFELHRLAQLEVERCERFVEQQCAREVDKRTCESDALLLATGQLGGLAVGEVGQSDHLEHLGDVGLVLALRDLLRLRSEADVVGNGHVREERVLLEDGVDIALVRRDSADVDAVQQDLAGCRLLEAGDHLECRRLPAAGRPEHREELALLDSEVRLLDRDEVTERLAHVIELNDDVAHSVAVAARSAGTGPWLMIE